MTDSTELDDLRAVIKRQAQEIEQLKRPTQDLGPCQCQGCAMWDAKQSAPQPDHNEGHV